jgi:hypothetical protein
MRNQNSRHSLGIVGLANQTLATPQAKHASAAQNSPSTYVLVADAKGVLLKGLVVDGINAGMSQCSPILFGVAFQNSSGTIEPVTVRNFKLTANLAGCQSGSGIFVQSGGGIAAMRILKATGSSGNLIRNNLVFGAPVTMQDPSEAKLISVISPLR